MYLAKVVMKKHDATIMFAGETQAVLDVDGEKRRVTLAQRSSDLTILGTLAINGYGRRVIHRVFHTANLTIVEVMWDGRRDASGVRYPWIVSSQITEGI